DEMTDIIMKKKGALPVSNETRAAIEEYLGVYGRWRADRADEAVAAEVAERREALLSEYLAAYSRLIDTEEEEGAEQ
ncbi:MAG: hypothetical protein J6V07_02540, partial [Clostridia bacterium]|nr:hypothetical protein [Clostridia bacterium]